MRLRSLLFVPAKEKMMQKIPSFNCDAVILDLEDSIEPEDKANALLRTEAYLEKHNRTGYTYVRLNSERFQDELQYLHRFSDIGFMLPKFEDAGFYSEAEKILRDHPIIALIETPKGLVNIRNIVACEWVDAVAFGAEDYTAKANMKNSIQMLEYQKNRIVMYAKAFEKAVYDTPSFQISDMELFEEEVRYAVDAGFDGKMAISPRQVDYINRSFSCCNMRLYKEIVKQYEDNGQAVCKIDGKIYEKMHIDRIKKVIKESGGD